MFSEMNAELDIDLKVWWRVIPLDEHTISRINGLGDDWHQAVL
ncbi:hypothetical protein N8492_01715 [Synechococcus sp. AH-601-O06]|nr:hypothetical protein [Synechococcus sp. AH-601-O06]